MPAAWEVSIVVVDNDTAPAARDTVDRAQAQSPFRIEYIHEPRRGISVARNRVLEAALSARAEWIGFIDDDEVAPPTWAAEMVNAALDYAADIIHGRVVRLFPSTLPLFVRPHQPVVWSEGAEIEYAPTNSVFMRSWLLAADRGGLRFDEAITSGKGEDVDFSVRARRLGARVVHTNRTTVYETVSPPRLTFRSQLRHYISTTAALYRFNVLGGRSGAPGKVAGRVLSGIFFLAIAPFTMVAGRRHFSDTFVRGCWRIAWAVGVLGGMAGWSFRPYSRIEGG